MLEMEKCHEGSICNRSQWWLWKAYHYRAIKGRVSCNWSNENQANQKEIMDMAREINLNQQLEIVEMDVTDEERIKEVSKWISDHFGQLDVLINNAGYSQGGFTSDLTMEEWENQYDTNVMGVIRTTFHLLSLLRKSTQGKIINMSSVSGYFGFPGMGPYCSSKFALEGYSESLRMELLPMRIYVSLVEPASFKTGIWEKGLEVGGENW